MICPKEVLFPFVDEYFIFTFPFSFKSHKFILQTFDSGHASCEAPAAFRFTDFKLPDRIAEFIHIDKVQATHTHTLSGGIRLVYQTLTPLLIAFRSIHGSNFFPLLFFMVDSDCVATSPTARRRICYFWFMHCALWRVLRLRYQTCFENEGKQSSSLVVQYDFYCNVNALFHFWLFSYFGDFRTLAISSQVMVA
jgi:hypothetical protein